eukprot:gnl/TRDRNA2_/TRDRNA2_119416_c1_seq2.p1 gnl/TRDRNA2_/TRDRNA2_119416_c1~~gnl/TRDRNA2_/TRDRNA2_119416_c1_seq2.p1  ORF type:complete len:308 (-),score=68.89 gnl/TRDRNA2_/TRDRNA2_119416_c1_seq2:55-978(-)
MDDSSQSVPLDETVLQGLRAFTRSNALKRAVLSVVAPVATLESVSHWADQFDALDERGCGEIGVQELATRLSELSVSKTEAAELTATLAAVDGDSKEMISYSAFLAACLSANMSLGAQQVDDLFDRLDSDSDGFVSIDQVAEVLGDVVDLEELRTDLGGDALSREKFSRLLLSPHLGLSRVGLRQLLGAFGNLPSRWRIDTLRAKVGTGKDEVDVEASRAENAAWRLWARDGVSAAPCAAQQESGTRAEDPQQEPASAEDLRDGLGENVRATWAVATAEAKSGDAEAVRRENMAWRTWHQEKLKSGS